MANNFFARFWGRQDVYAKRNENKDTGKAGYFTQCRNFWTSACHRKLKTGVSCKNCEYYEYKPLTKEDILAHLRGNAYNASDVIGVYPLLKNNTCRFLVFDFDNHEKNAEENDFANVDDAWIEEVEAMRNICVLNGIDPLVERSRSGWGAHIWIFFDKPIPASLARRFGTALLDRGAECVNLKSFKYYDRMTLVKMNEYYPDLMERIIRREPNAYLAALYWDSEMFGRSTAIRRQNEKGKAQKDYKAALLELFSDMDTHFQTKHKRYVADRYRNFFMNVSVIADNKDCKAIYEALISGDPKTWSLRSLYQQIYSKYIEEAKKKEKLKNG